MRDVTVVLKMNGHELLLLRRALVKEVDDGLADVGPVAKRIREMDELRWEAEEVAARAEQAAVRVLERRLG